MHQYARFASQNVKLLLLPQTLVAGGEITHAHSPKTGGFTNWCLSNSFTAGTTLAAVSDALAAPPGPQAAVNPVVL